MRFSLDACSVDRIRRLEELGVTDAIVCCRSMYEGDGLGLEHETDVLRRYAEDVIAVM